MLTRTLEYPIWSTGGALIYRRRNRAVAALYPSFIGSITTTVAALRGGRPAGEWRNDAFETFAPDVETLAIIRRDKIRIDDGPGHAAQNIERFWKGQEAVS